ncbi:hypothetical protein LTR10_020372 [Elasticomyces elasticus]|uniref:BZIP domain-containing protein n=1 Tax=Exophiala sideris TaxID=1016849 RepID=A0ABR0JLB7_9EURO|nr:hypothetical protein LTR10_020372 [Elasticomyces elasticus]KAK5036372.1 hypothetical protein LTS07_002099 [Exophiala sideris]KAK5041796.1 hypothetical protein LTR13_002463 [Exophiala sideris]KAK5066756.1 hypothetical protein LTR69_002103 [Exophiala sideris]KAK5184814.1 hypothetical protein LTR44_002660 [Eurotiomycetes sp. CCFEE 6388]
MTSPIWEKARTQSGTFSQDDEQPGEPDDDPSNDQKLTLQRRLKKRESDRKCQRMSRERTKSRITYLEGLVEKLSHADDSGKVASLLTLVSQLQEERDSLSSKIKNIEAVLFPGSAPTTESAVTEGALPAESVSLSKSASIEALSATPQALQTSLQTYQQIKAPSITSHAIMPAQLTNQSARHSNPNMARASIHGLSSPRYMPLHPSARGGMCECTYAKSLKDQRLNYWFQGNETLSAWMKWPTLVPPVPEEDPFHDDTPIRAVVEGWDSVEQRGHVHPMWRLMRTMDEHLFVHAHTPRDRLGILYNVSRVLSAHIDPTRKQYAHLPTYWFTRSVSQHNAYAINFVSWPGLRQILDADEHRYCSNHFWRSFINSIRVDWPYELRDMYLFNASKGLYKVSPLFEELLGDIRNIGVTSNFLQHFPELQTVVNVVDEMHYGPLPNGGPCQLDVDGMDLFEMQNTEGRVFDPETTTEVPMAGMMGSIFNSSCGGHVEIGDHSNLPAYVSSRDFV